MRLHVTDVRMTLASRSEAETGLYAYVSFRLGPVIVDGTTLRRTRGGDLMLSFPARRSQAGRDHPQVRPINRAARREIEEQVFAALGLTEGAL